MSYQIFFKDCGAVLFSVKSRCTWYGIVADAARDGIISSAEGCGNGDGSVSASPAGDGSVSAAAGHGTIAADAGYGSAAGLMRVSDGIGTGENGALRL